MRDEIEKAIYEIIGGIKVDDVAVEDLTPDKSFKDDLNFDSLDLAQLVMKIEEHFEEQGIEEIDLGEVEGLETIGKVIDYLDGKIKK